MVTFMTLEKRRRVHLAFVTSVCSTFTCQSRCVVFFIAGRDTLRTGIVGIEMRLQLLISVFGFLSVIARLGDLRIRLHTIVRVLDVHLLESIFVKVDWARLLAMRSSVIQKLSWVSVLSALGKTLIESLSCYKSVNWGIVR